MTTELRKTIERISSMINYQQDKEWVKAYAQVAKQLMDDQIDDVKERHLEWELFKHRNNLK